MSILVNSKNINAKNGVIVKNNKRQNKSIFLKLPENFLFVVTLATIFGNLDRRQNDVGVQAQTIDCSAGFLCDFFRRFPHLPFSRLHPQNSGYIRTLDYMISKDKDVVPHQHYSASAKNNENYYQQELLEIRNKPLHRIVAPSNFPVNKPSTGRKYEPKVTHFIARHNEIHPTFSNIIF